MEQGLYTETGGEGAPTLLLLHGLAATGHVWDGIVARLPGRWPGRWIVPDLPGHGRSAHVSNYGIGAQAAAVAELVGDGQEGVVICGHSLGGLIALTLATGWYRIEVSHVVAIGVKVTWTPEELARIESFAASPTRWFDTKEEALDRFLKVSGLAGLWTPESDRAQAGVVEENGNFRLAADQRTVLAGAPPLDRCLRAANTEISLMCGGNDALVTIDELRQYDPEAVLLEGCGHSAMVEAPDAVLDHLCKFTGVAA